MIRVIKFIKGYVCIRVSGYSPERFMNLCSNHNILLWNIENHGEAYTMCVSIDGFFKLKSALKKTRTKAAIEKRCGLPFLIPKMKRRKMFIFGLLFCAAFLMIMSEFLWAVEFQGNTAITDDMMADFLKEQGVHIGMRKGSLDIESMEDSLRGAFAEITWTSARIDGTKLTIQIKENETVTPQTAEEKKEGAGQDIVADREGIITAMITRSGVPEKAIGDEVKPGDILVSGKVPIYNEDTTLKRYAYCTADADILLRYQTNVREVLPEAYKIKVYTGNDAKKYFMKVMEKEYIIPKHIPYLKSDCAIEEKQFCLSDNFYLPFSCGSYHYREYVMVEKNYLPKEAETILKTKFIRLIKTLDEKGVQIIEKNVKIVTDYKTTPKGKNKNYILEGSLMVVGPEGVLKETKTDE